MASSLLWYTSTSHSIQRNICFELVHSTCECLLTIFYGNAIDVKKYVFNYGMSDGLSFAMNSLNRWQNNKFHVSTKMRIILFIFFVWKMFCGLLFRIVLRLVQRVTWFFWSNFPPLTCIIVKVLREFCENMHFFAILCVFVHRPHHLWETKAIIESSISAERTNNDDWVRRVTYLSFWAKENFNSSKWLSKWCWSCSCRISFRFVHFFSWKRLRTKNKRKKKPAPVLDSVGNFVFVWINVHPLENEAKY